MAFTGKKNGVMYYKGIRWLGPPNMVGARCLKPWTLIGESHLGPGGLLPYGFGQPAGSLVPAMRKRVDND